MITSFLLLSTFGCAKQQLKNAEPPTPQEIFDRYDKIVNPDNLQEWDNIHFAGTMEMPLMNMSVPLESWIIRNEGMLTTYDIPEVGTGGQGTNLEYAWMIDPIKGDRLMEGAELDNALHEYNKTLLQSTEELYKDSSVTRMDTLNDEQVWVIEAINAVDDQKTTLFFAVESGLLVGQNQSVPSGKGSIKIKMQITEYAALSGTNALFPKIMETKTMGMTQIISFDVLEMNAANPPTIEPPASILPFIESSTPPEAAPAPEAEEAVEPSPEPEVIEPPSEQ